MEIRSRATVTAKHSQRDDSLLPLVHDPSETTNGTDDHEDINAKTKRSKRRRGHGKRQRPKPNGWKICAGGILSVGLLAFMSIWDVSYDGSLERNSATTSMTNHASSKGPLCQYDGHCPERSICAVRTNQDTNLAGQCQPFVNNTILPPSKSISSKSRSPPPTASVHCYDTCLQELRLDEHFYHASWPLVDHSFDVTQLPGLPKGCAIVFQRQKEDPSTSSIVNELQNFDTQHPPDKKGLYKDVKKSIVDWVEHKRFQYLKRVDPYDSNGDRWIAYCTQTCRTDVDCQTHVSDPQLPAASRRSFFSFPGWNNQPNGFICNEHKACVRNPDYWDKPQSNVDLPRPVIFVTALTGPFYEALLNLAASIRFWAPNHKMVVYNLGDLSEAQLKAIQSWSNVESVEWWDGIPAQYPDHVRKAKNYAWKPLIVNETLHKYKHIFWLDAGSTLVGPIDHAIQITQQQGIMLMKGQDDDMRGMSFPETYQWFGFDKDTMDVGGHFSGNTQAYLSPSRYVDSIVRRNAECALDADCIAPPRSNKSTHRYDQTSLSVLAYSPNIRLPHYTEFLAAHREQLNDNLRDPHFRFAWSSRYRCHYFTTFDKESRAGVSLVEQRKAPSRWRDEDERRAAYAALNDRHPKSKLNDRLKKLQGLLEGDEEIPDTMHKGP